MNELPFPMNKGERRKSVAHARSEIPIIKLVEKIGFSEKGMPWDSYDSGSFGVKGILAEFISRNIISRNKIDSFFAEGGKNVVEIGGPASRLSTELRQIYPDNSIEKTVGITLLDFKIPQPGNHKVIEGDVTLPMSDEESPYSKVIDFVGKNRADLIISRMKAGLQEMPKDPFLFAEILQGIYKELLSPTGVMLFELNEIFMPFLSKWEQLLRQTPGIEMRWVHFHAKIKGKEFYRAHVYIKRSIEAPEEIPMLGVRDIREVYRQIHDGSWERSVPKINIIT